MDVKEYLALAYDLFQEAYQCQMDGELEAAIELYQRSIEAYPTAEAHTFLGWTYSFQGKLDDAIAECKKAIARDPASHFLMESLNQSLQAKMELMRTAALLPSRT